VVFIREIVPSFLISNSARFFYNENYMRCSMRHRIEEQTDCRRFEYAWEHEGDWHQFSAASGTEEQPVAPGSLEEFITDHEWGYTGQQDGGTLEYRVVHPKWTVSSASECKLNCNVRSLYGAAFEPFLTKEPSSAFMISGSEVAVYQGTKLEGTAER